MVKPPNIDPASVPTYEWEPWPVGMTTRRQLTGKTPGPIRGKIPYSKAADGSGYLWVYLEAEAVPIVKTEKQLAAAEARRIGHTCTRCGSRHRRYIKGGGLCGYCSDYDQVVAWAADMLAGGCLLLDTETTGFGERAEIVEIAVINHRGDVLLNTLVKPRKPIPGDASAVHGITDDDVASAPEFGDVYALLYPILRGQRVLIYNADYDTGVLRYCRRVNRLPEFAWGGGGPDCLMESYAQFCGVWSDRHNDYKWPALRGGHRALSDCQAALHVLKKIAAGTDRRPIYDEVESYYYSDDMEEA